MEPSVTKSITAAEDMLAQSLPGLVAAWDNDRTDNVFLRKRGRSHHHKKGQDMNKHIHYIYKGLPKAIILACISLAITLFIILGSMYPYIAIAVMFISAFLTTAYYFGEGKDSLEKDTDDPRRNETY